MLIEPKTLATLYEAANLVEEFIANLVVEHGGAKSVSDLATGVARAGYDFRLDNVPIELKMTASWKIPVEIKQSKRPICAENGFSEKEGNLFKTKNGRKRTKKEGRRAKVERYF